MRLMLVICGTAFLGACATIPSPDQSETIEAGLPTSKLEPGQCGLFGWSTDASRQFIFYADETTARYNGVAGPVDLTAKSVFPATEYADPMGQPVTLRLGESEAMIGGMRYPGARLISLDQEGWERIQPVAIIRTCQTK